MVVPKIGSQYLLKKAYDLALAPPKPRPAAAHDEEPASAPQAAYAAAPMAAGPDRIVVQNEEGSTLGVAYRLDGLGLYLVSGGKPRSATTLMRALEHEGTQLLPHVEGGRLVGIIVIPGDHGPSGEAIRADEI
jgi:hypothetical protein